MSIKVWPDGRPVPLARFLILLGILGFCSISSLILVSIRNDKRLGNGIALRFADPTISSKAGQEYGGLPTFRYAIIYNDPAFAHGRTLHVLMDPSEFSEKNLRTLFVLLSRRFKDLPAFDVDVQTSLQDIDTPEQHDFGYSEAPGNPKASKSPCAFIEHSAKSDTLYMYFPSRTAPVKKIDLRAPVSD